VIRRRLPPSRHPVWFFIVLWIAVAATGIGLAAVDGLFTAS